MRTRYGGRLGKGMVHEVLTSTTYIGQHRFNTYDAKKKWHKPPEEQAVMEVPPIISVAEFEAVQRSLKVRSPKMMPPRAVGGSTLLTGICFCASCNGAMTLRTGSLLHLRHQGEEGRDRLQRRFGPHAPAQSGGCRAPGKAAARSCPP